MDKQLKNEYLFIIDKYLFQIDKQINQLISGSINKENVDELNQLLKLKKNLNKNSDNL